MNQSSIHLKFSK